MMRLQERHWRRHGHDRTYLSLPSGDSLGWINNLNGAVHADDPEARLLIDAWLKERGRDSVPLPELDLDRPLQTALPEASEAVADDWEDFALRKPGEAARARANEELERLRNKSKLGTFLLRVTDQKTDERSWRVGAIGEEVIGDKLESLREFGWRALHSIPIGEHGSDIDHLLMGPAGVWTINTKLHPGKRVWVSPHQVRVNGKPVPYLRNSEFEARRVHRILTDALGWEVPVRGALVFMTGTLIPNVKVVGHPEQVDIFSRADVVRRFRRMVPFWTAEEVNAVFEMARRSSTWKGVK